VRIAGAPISWGVCEVPGWGHQMSPDRVLAEMRDTGLTATEFGPDGFLPPDPAEREALLGSYGLAAVGGFVPVVLHEPAYDPLPEVERALRGFGGAPMLVLAAVTGRDGYDERPVLSAENWSTLLANLDRVAAYADGLGRRTALHPHVGTIVEGPDEVDRVLTGSGVPLCLDTGHLLIGGTDPLTVARSAPERIAHVHLKDVDASAADRVRSGQATYTEAVRDGLYRPLGAGDLDTAAIVTALDQAGYQGWYVLEQDMILDAEPPPGDGPVVDVRRGVAFLNGLKSVADLRGR
jgi:inosose dehydratase